MGNMKEKKHKLTKGWLSTVAMAALLGMYLTSCEGPMGPAGKDANENCIQCHNDETRVLAKMLQHANSQHQMGTSFERNAANCAACHSHEGFTDRMLAGTMDASAAVDDPTPAGCRTCHNIHNAYDETDWAISFPEPVTLFINDVEMDFGNANICANCHQPRIPDPVLTAGGGNLNITSSRWGPHHGTQSTMVWGTAGYEYSGTTYPSKNGTHPHADATCTTCHMADAYGAQAGGHTFRMSYDYHGSEEENIAGCTTCHQSLEEFDYNGKMTEIEGLWEDLRDELINIGWVKASDGLVNASSGSPLNLSPDEAGAIYNYLFVMEDKSSGIHNPGYAKALLQGSLDFLATK